MQALFSLLGNYLIFIRFEYIHTGDSTLGGSRNAIAPLIFWKKFYQENDLKEIVETIIEHADYAINELKKQKPDSFRASVF